MSVLRYPFTPSPAPKEAITTDEVFVVLGTRYVYTYRLKESNADWGPEIPYVQGTHLTFGNTTGQPLFFTIEFITRTFVLDVEQPPELRRQEFFVVESTTTLSLDGISVSPAGPVTSTPFAIFVQVGTVSGPPSVASVTGTYELKQGLTTILSGSLTFSVLPSTTWVSADIPLPAYYASSPISRDLVINVTAYPAYGSSVAGANTFSGYWIATLVNMTIGSITVAPPAPVTTATFVVSVPIDFNGGPSAPVGVTGTYSLKQGPTVILSGPLSFTEIAPTLWESNGILLPEFYNAVPLARDLVIGVTVTPTDPNVTPVTGSLTVPGYWAAVVVVGPSTTTYRALMSNYQDFWMQMDRLPGVRHSFAPSGGDVSADDLYVVSVLPIAETAPFFEIYKASLGSSPGGWSYESTEVAWTDFTSTVGTIAGMRAQFTPTAANASTFLVVTHPTAGDWQVQITPAMVGIPQDISATAFAGNAAAGLYSVFLRDYSYSGDVSVTDLIVTVKG
jgi:hypothetical protein